MAAKQAAAHPLLLALKGREQVCVNFCGVDQVFNASPFVDAVIIDPAWAIADRGNFFNLRKKVHIIKAGRDYKVRRPAANPRHTRLKRGEQRMTRWPVARKIIGDFINSNAALGNFAGG